MANVKYFDLSGEKDLSLSLKREAVSLNVDTLAGIDLYGFIANMERTLHVARPGLRFDPAYPEYLSEKLPPDGARRFENAVTWDVANMVPANTGKPNRNPDSGDFREAKPRLRSTEVFDEEGNRWKLKIQNLFAWLRFDVWAHTAYEAEEIAQWLFTFMQTYGGRFGSQQVRFSQRLRDRELLKINNKLQTRTLEYTVLLEEYTASKHDLIEEITVDVESITG